MLHGINVRIKDVLFDATLWCNFYTLCNLCFLEKRVTVGSINASDGIERHGRQEHLEDT